VDGEPNANRILESELPSAETRNEVEVIRSLVGRNAVDSALGRLLDLTRAAPRPLRNQAIAVSAKHQRLRTECRVEGAHPDIRREQSRVSLQILELLGAIEDQTPPSITNGNASNTVDSSATDRAGLRRAFFASRTVARETFSAPPVLYCQKLGTSLAHGQSQFLLSEVSFAMDLRTITGVVAANGHGKTTLLRVIAGELPHLQGTLLYPLLSPETARIRDWRQVKRHIAYVPQSPADWGPCDLETALRFVAALHRREDADGEVDWILSRLELEPYRRARWDRLSGGYRLRAWLALALMRFPRLLVLDEPLANLDIIAQRVFLQELRDLASSALEPLAVLITSQHVHEIESIADQMIFLEQGKPLFAGSREHFLDISATNTFEIEVDVSQEDLRHALSNAGLSQVEQSGTNLYVLRAPRELSAETFLATLLEKKVRVHYFRDISGSVRLLMRSAL
jgi:ABC-2 type transport system ATP-binding protein